LFSVVAVAPLAGPMVAAIKYAGVLAVKLGHQRGC